MTKHRLIAYLFLGVLLSAISAFLDYQLRLPTGLTRSVATGPGFDGPALEAPVIDPRVGLDFLEADPSLPRRFFSVRWDGVLYVEHDGGLDFYGGADDRLVLRVDGRVVLERSAARGMNTASQNVQLSPGFHELEVEYEQYGGGYRLNLQWAPTGGAPRALDPESVFPSQPELGRVKTNRRLANLRTCVWVFWIVPPLLLAAVRGAPRLRRRTAVALRAGRSLAIDHPVAASVFGLSMVALALRLGYVFLVADYPGFVWVDPDGYTRKARLLTEGGSWRWTIEAARYQRDYFKAPLYPLFLSFFSQLPNYLFTAAVAEACLAALATVGVFFIGHSLHSSAAGLLGSAAYAVYYPSVASMSDFMQERLYVPLLIASLALLTRSVTRPTALPTFAVAGGLLGLAALARSMPVFLAVPAALWYWFSAADRRQATARIGAFLSGLCVVVVPYCALLFVETRQVIAIENIGGFGVLRAYPPGRELVAGYAPTTAEVIRVLWHRFEPAPFAYLWGIARTVLGSFQSSVGRGLEWSWSFPSATTALIAKGFGHVAGDFLFLCTILLAPLGAVLAKHRIAASLLVLWVAVHLFFTALAGYGGPRFRQPIEPVLFALAACALVSAWRRAPRGALIAAAGVSLILAWPALRTLPYSLSSRADYGVGIWKTTEEGRTTSTTTGRTGFNVRASDDGVVVRLWSLDDGGIGSAPAVEIQVDGVSVGDVRIDDTGRSIRFDSSPNQLHFVELRPRSTAAASARRFGLELFDHAARVGR